MGSTIVKRSIQVERRKTSVSLEDAFWRALKQIAAERRITISELITIVSRTRQKGNLSSHLRLLILDYFKKQASLRSEVPSANSSEYAGVHLGGGTGARPFDAPH